jgi:hypothetical protein
MSMAKTSNNTRKLSLKLAKAETEVCKTMVIKENCKPPNAVHIQAKFFLSAIILSIIIIFETKTKIEFLKIIFKMRNSNTI